jgi:predicted metalloprotease with PDZ domain
MRTLLLTALVLTTACGVSDPARQTSLAFTVSMEPPGEHLFHVTLRAGGLQGELQDFKMPVWMPGYYRRMDYARHVRNFRAEDGTGNPLPSEQVTHNTWRVATGGASDVRVHYDVEGTRAFVAENFLDETRAFIAPPGLYMHVEGMIDHPVTVTIDPPAGWQRISTGLDPVEGQPNTFSAPDFDVLFDCPTLLGNQELLEFQVQGIPHRVVLEYVPPHVDREKMLADLQRVVETASGILGDIPYKHYTFLMIGRGNGGIEHLNSAAIAFNSDRLDAPDSYRGWLSYVTHEYFHHYNPKRIRPIALGPFDYDTENLTHMLWVSEGFTSYYQNIVMVRAGLMTQEQYLERIQNLLAGFENSTGRRYQSVAENSWDIWHGSQIGGDRRTSVSYYSKGPAIGVLLDLKIRHETGNKQSLDDVMRGLYQQYYLEKKRGFTDAEFRQECERVAGADLSDVFEAVWTTKDIDYAKYLSYAGLEIDLSPKPAEGVELGVNAKVLDRKLLVAGVSAGSPAEKAGLAAGDEIVDVAGKPASVVVLADALESGRPGQTLRLAIARNGTTRQSQIVLSANRQRSFALKPVANPTEQQKAILADWLRTPQGN